MKLYSRFLGLLLFVGLWGCSNVTTETAPKKDQSVFPLEVNTFTFEELFEVGGGGCGMVLWKPDATPRQDGILFSHGLGDDFPAIMVLDGEITKLERIAAIGQDFYGQQTSQTFISGDGKINVQVNVTLGTAGEIESISISEGKIIIKIEEQTKNIAVVGDAGC